MAIYRGAGGAGDATGDSASEALLVRELAIKVQADAAAAEAAKIAAQAAKVAAETAETNAETAETNAETAETNAETAATNAASSASAASTSATNAASSASAASTSATNASNSATAASNSASAASTSATNAASSASSASASASTATTQATNASNSATAAATSATNASNSATAAATSETNAANSATAAAGSATSAASSASTATTQAGLAAASATAAQTAETNAETAETNAAASASAASTSASNAATLATNASNSASAALASQIAAEAAFDAFDDIYLGAKSSNPTVDNDGDALTIGDQYFNTVSNELRIWNGSSWQAASTVGGTVSSLTVTGATALNGGATLGDASGDALTINSSAVSIPNGLNFNSNSLVLNTSGNLGLGVTPSAWNSGFKVIQIGATSSIYNNNAGDTFIGANFYTDASGVNRYLTTTLAAAYGQLDGQHLFFTAGSGTAGNAISFTQALTLHASGGMSLGATSDPGAANLTVAGTITGGKGPNVASTGFMTLGAGNFFDITGTTTISNIAIKPAGTVVYLKFNGTLNLQTGGIGNSGAMRLTGGATIIVTQYDVLTLISDGTNWWQIGLNSN